jgi:integration host factor subunit beta
MLKSELIEELRRESPHLTRDVIARTVKRIFVEIREALVHGDRVELRGFGVFHTNLLDARQARNPRTGSPVQVNEKALVRFRTGRTLARRLQLPLESKR